MATQGLLTFMDESKNVLVKIVAGCNGCNAIVAEEEVDPVNSPQAMWETALEAGFGCAKCLMVITPDDIYPDDVPEEVKERARRTFNQSQFNPRWKYGTADYVVVV